MRDRKLVGSRQRSLSCRFSLPHRERPLLAGKWIQAMNKENESLLHELQESKSKERIYKFSLERFSRSSKDIKFYTGFPDYLTLVN